MQSYVVWKRVAHLRTNPTAPPYDIGPLDSPVDMYVDDTLGVGRSDHVRVARDRVVLVSEGILAPGTAISTIASSVDILGYQVDCLAVTTRPKDRAIDKLFYVLFSFSCSDWQPLVLWQCDPWDAPFLLSSFTRRVKLPAIIPNTYARLLRLRLLSKCVASGNGSISH